MWKLMKCAACVMLIVGAMGGRCVWGAQLDRPNVLMIVLDDQNDWLGCMGGHPQVKTPHIDRLAKRGTLFLNAHCQAPLCQPSRTSVMTGRRPSSTGIYGLFPWFRALEELKDAVTLPQHFAAHGYTTYTTGKIYHRDVWKDSTLKEFDVAGPGWNTGLKPKTKRVPTMPGSRSVDWGLYPFEDSDQRDWKVASWTTRQLDRKPKEPFFIAVGFSLPHLPLLATQKWFDLYPDDQVMLPPYLEGDRDDTPRFSWYLHWKLTAPRRSFLVEIGQSVNLVRSYLACVSFVDSQVGRVLAALDRSGHAKDTVVVLWSDHGWHLGEKQITGKNSLWERSARVPLIFAGPGVAVGARCERPAELLDIYPTLTELCGLTEAKGLEGMSLMAQLRNAKAPRDRPAITTHNHDNHGVRSQRWRYIRYADGSEELYDMAADPNEWHNLAGDPQYAGVISDHQRWLPTVNRQPAPGSAMRILIYENGKANWEGEDIGHDDLIPQ